MFDIEVHFEQVTSILEKAEIPLGGLFINFDAGFDSEKLREKLLSKDIIGNICQNKRNKKSDDEKGYYFDEKLYKKHYSIERSNAWMDRFRSILNRFDTTVSSWFSFNHLTFIVLGLKNLRHWKSRDEFIIK